MRKRNSAVPSFKADGGADYGPALRPRSDGRLVNWGGAAVVEIESRDDPDLTDRRRIVRGARRRDALSDLEARKVISKRMRDAAEQFLEDCSIASGASGGDFPGMPSVPGPRSGLPERQVGAITRVNHVRHLLGMNSGTVFWWVVFQNGSLRAYEDAHHMRNGAATKMLKAALDALDAHYQGDGVRVPA